MKKIKIFVIAIVLILGSFFLVKHFKKPYNGYRKLETGFALFKPSDFFYYLPLPNTGKSAIYTGSIREIDGKKYVCVVIEKRQRPGGSWGGVILYEFSSKLEEVQIGETYQKENVSFTELKNFDPQKSVVAFFEHGAKTLYDFKCK